MATSTYVLIQVPTYAMILCRAAAASACCTLGCALNAPADLMAAQRYTRRRAVLLVVALAFTLALLSPALRQAAASSCTGARRELQAQRSVRRGRPFFPVVLGWDQGQVHALTRT